jgi:hypothetical protein
MAKTIAKEIEKEEIKEVKETKVKSSGVELKENWEELLQESIAKSGESHIEAVAIKPLINGLIK